VDDLFAAWLAVPAGVQDGENPSAFCVAARHDQSGIVSSAPLGPLMHTDISVIFVGDNGWTDMAPDLPAERMTSAHGFHKQWWKGVTLYHRNGYKYEVENANDRKRRSRRSRSCWRRPSTTQA
jgi:hypothetical protein